MTQGHFYLFANLYQVLTRGKFKLAHLVLYLLCT